jgi:protein TonB
MEKAGVMTAAALKPNLMTHLFATQPDRPDSGTLSASLISVALHVAVGAAAVWASIELTPAPVRPLPDVVQPTIYTVPQPPIVAPSTPRSGASPASSSSLGYMLPVPDPTVVDIPAPGAMAEPVFAEPGAPAPTPGAGQPGAPAGAGGMNGEFQIVQVMPALINAREVQRALERAYPPLLRDAGIGGRAHLWLFIDENGYVIRAQLKETSGHKALDEVALEVAPMMKFSPAMNRDQRVKVMVHVPLEFRTN